jgi:hypothetical protein
VVVGGAGFRAGGRLIDGAERDRLERGSVSERERTCRWRAVVAGDRRMTEPRAERERERDQREKESVIERKLEREDVPVIGGAAAGCV